PTQRVSTPKPARAERTYSPNGSFPTFVMTADRRPSRAAATATFVALPPRDFANERTSGSRTPICSGYRSTPTLPMVMTSSDMGAHVVEALLEEPRRPRLQRVEPKGLGL